MHGTSEVDRDSGALQRLFISDIAGLTLKDTGDRGKAHCQEDLEIENMS